MDEQVSGSGPAGLQAVVWFSASPLMGAVTIRPVAGVLELVDRMLRFTAVQGGNRPVARLEQFAEKPRLAEQLKRGENVVALEVPLTEAQITFPRLQAGSIMKLRARGKTWRFAFYNYAKGGATAADPLGLGAASSQLQGRAAAAPWRKALGN